VPKLAHQPPRTTVIRHGTEIRGVGCRCLCFEGAMKQGFIPCVSQSWLPQGLTVPVEFALCNKSHRLTVH
jgi:hypothetical protein